ncbi:MAG: hypothetical protein VKJ27_00325 [Synechocystis sp.]|nr:hypothetical protein [Synechocystis sp.]
MFNPLPFVLNTLGDWNPQLYRELKSRLTFAKGRWVILASLLFQGGLVFFLSDQLPLLNKTTEQYSRYCFGSVNPPDYYYDSQPLCTMDFKGALQVNWQLWGLDVFTVLSAMGIILLLVIGVYLLIADLQKEAQQGTVNFLRLSPLSESEFIWGKIGGVPSLLYGFLLICLPLHLITAAIAGIPLVLLLGYYGVLAASAVFFFHLALWIGLSTNCKNPALFQTQSAAIAGLLGIVLVIFTASSAATDPWDPVFLSWFGLLYPGKVLNYLVESTFMAPEMVGYFHGNDLLSLRWYGMGLFQFAPLGMAFMVMNFAEGTYWVQQVLKRRFRRPQSTAWSKQQSFGLTLSFVAIANGFVFQSEEVGSYHGDYLLLNLGTWQLSLWLFFLGLTLALLPHRHYLKEWSRYHHEAPRQYRTWGWQALHNENSPALTAIAANLGLAALLSLPLLIVLLPDSLRSISEYKPGWILIGFCAGLGGNFTVATLWQWGLGRLGINRLFVFVLTVVAMGAMPVVLSVGAHINSPTVLWFSPLPILAMDKQTSALFFLSLLAQATLIAGSQWQFRRYLNRLGRSESQFYPKTLTEAAIAAPRG